MAAYLGTDSIIILNAELITNPRDNSLYRDWENATSVTVPHCNVQAFPLAEKLQFEFNLDREFTRSGFRVYAPANTAVFRTSRVRWRDEEYDVHGEPGPWHALNPPSRLDHVAFIIRLIAG